MSAPPPLPIRAVDEDQHEAFIRTSARGFGYSLDDDTCNELIATELTEGSRAIAGHDDGQMVGTAVALDWTIAVPYAPAVRCAGVTSVTVLPTHRRRGVLRSLMRHQLDDLASDGPAWAALYSSESAIYGRFGYGVATRCVTGRIDRPWTAFVEPVQAATVEMVSPAQAVDRIPAIYETLAARTPGMLAVPERYWQHRIVWDPPGERAGASERTVVIIADRAYAMYRLANDWDETGSKSKLTVEECLATDSEAHRQLWTYLFGVDLAQHVTINRLSVDHPLPWWLAERQRLRLTSSMPLYIRLIDVGTALSERGTRGEAVVVLDVVDGFCPWNERSWALEGDGQQLRCTPTDRTADLTLDVRELASLSLGGVRPTELANAGLLAAHTPGALTRLEALLAGPRLPFNAFTF